MSKDYPARYWWVVLVVVPLGAALIAVIPSLFKGSDDESPVSSNSIAISGSRVDGDIQIVDKQVLLQQLVETGLAEAQVAELKSLITQSQALLESKMYEAAADRLEQLAAAAPTAAAFNNLGALRIEQGDPVAARAALDAGLALDPDYEPLLLNSVRLHIQQGNAAEAISQLAVAEDSASVRQLRTNVEETVAAGAIEREPNDDLLNPNLLPMERWVAANLSSSQDSDVFLFETEAVPRDYVAIELDNRDPWLAYSIEVYDESKAYLGGFVAGNEGEDGLLEFSAEPESRYLAVVAGKVFNKGGSYRLRAVHRHRYDAYEPNDDLLQPRPLASLDSIRASLMDGRDLDHYALPLAAGRFTVHLSNESQELNSVMNLYSPQRELLRYARGNNAGHDYSLTFEVPDAGNYYLSVRPETNNPGGDYRLDFELD